MRARAVTFGAARYAAMTQPRSRREKVVRPSPSRDIFKDRKGEAVAEPSAMWQRRGGNDEQDGAGQYFEDLSIGMGASIAHTMTEKDIEEFARISSDVNPVHLDEAHAATTPFKQRIAHGILAASYISAVFGTKSPGPGYIYISQTLNFKAPVHIGHEVIATVKITDLIPETRRAIFHCVCKVGDSA